MANNGYSQHRTMMFTTTTNIYLVCFHRDIVNDHGSFLLRLISPTGPLVPVPWPEEAAVEGGASLGDSNPGSSHSHKWEHPQSDLSMP